MSEGDHVELQGKIIETMGGGFYKIQLDNVADDKIVCVRAKLSGTMKQKHIRVNIDDTVKVSPYDMSLGLITWRIR